MPKTEISSTRGIIETPGGGLVIQGTRVSDDGSAAGCAAAAQTVYSNLGATTEVNYVPIMGECRLVRLRATVSGDVGARAGLLRIFKNGTQTAAAIAISGSAAGAESTATPGSNTDITFAENQLWPLLSGSIAFNAGDALSAVIDIASTNSVSMSAICELEKV